MHTRANNYAFSSTHMVIGGLVIDWHSFCVLESPKYSKNRPMNVGKFGINVGKFGINVGKNGTKKVHFLRPLKMHKLVVKWWWEWSQFWSEFGGIKIHVYCGKSHVYSGYYSTLTGPRGFFRSYGTTLSRCRTHTGSWHVFDTQVDNTPRRVFSRRNGV